MLPVPTVTTTPSSGSTSEATAAPTPTASRVVTPPGPRDGTDHLVEANGLRFRVRESGRPDAPPLIVLHGIMGHAREWDTLVEALAPSFRVLTVDQRGHGRSSWADEYSAAAMAGDLVALADAFGLERTHVLAHSMGGMVTMVAAAAHPDRFDRLVLVDVGPDSPAVPGAVEELVAFLGMLDRSSYAHPQEAVDEWLAGDPYARPELVQHYVEHCLVLRQDGRWTWCLDARGLPGFVTGGVSVAELWHAVDHLRAPTLVVRGEHSPFLPADPAERMVQRLAAGTLVEIADGAHDLGVQQPEAVAHAARDFLTES